MDKETLIDNSVKKLRRLSKQRLNEVVDFIDFISNKYDEEVEIQTEIESLIEKSSSFSFLSEEEELYNIKDLKEKY